jgi:hypothetical protein
VLQEPIPRGRSYSYAAPTDSLAAAAARAFTAEGLSLERDTVVGSTRLLVGSGGVTFMSWGEIDRAAITPTAEGAEVRMISRSRRSLDFFHRDRSSRLFQVLDRELGGTGVQVIAGDRVRLVLSGPEQRTLTGIVLPAAGDSASIFVETEGRAQVFSGDDLARISVSRGRYGHAREGGVVGLLFGGVTGFILAGGEDGSQWGGLQRVAGSMIGSLAGLVTGGLIGAAVRTEVWSDVSPRGSAGPPSPRTTAGEIDLP